MRNMSKTWLMAIYLGVSTTAFSVVYEGRQIVAPDGRLVSGVSPILLNKAVGGGRARSPLSDELSALTGGHGNNSPAAVAARVAWLETHPFPGNSFPQMAAAQAQQAADQARADGAARRIQGVWQGYQARRQAQRANAALTVQKTFRGYLVRKELKKQREAAIVIQARIRGYLARKRVRKIALKQAAQVPGLRQNNARLSQLVRQWDGYNQQEREEARARLVQVTGEMENRLRSMKIHINGLTSELQTSETMRVEVLGQNRELEGQLQQAQQELQAAQDQVQRLTRGLLKSNTQTNQAQAQASQLEQQLSQLQTNFEAMQRELGNAKMDAADYKQLEEASDLLLQSVKKENQELRQQLSALQNDLREQTSNLQNRLHKVRAEKATGAPQLPEQIKRLQKQVSDLESLNVQTQSNFETQKLLLQGDLDLALTNSAARQGEIAVLTQELKSLQSHQDEDRKAYRQSLRDVIFLAEELKVKAQELETQGKISTETQQKLSSEIATLKLEISVSAQQGVELQNLVQKYEAEKQQASKKIEAAMESIEALKEQVEEKSRQSEELGLQVQQQQTQIQRLQGRPLSDQDSFKLKKLEQEQANAERSRTALLNTIENLKQAALSSKRALQSAQQMHQQKTQDYDAKMEQQLVLIKKLESQVAEQEKSAQAGTENNERLQQLLAQLQREKEFIKNERDSLLATVTSANRQRERMVKLEETASAFAQKMKARAGDGVLKALAPATATSTSNSAEKPVGMNTLTTVVSEDE